MLLGRAGGATGYPAAGTLGDIDPGRWQVAGRHGSGAGVACREAIVHAGFDNAIALLVRIGRLFRVHLGHGQAARQSRDRRGDHGVL